MKFLFLKNAIVALILFFIPFVAFSSNIHEKPKNLKIYNACKQEIYKICPNTKKGNISLIKKCISSNRYKISKKCQQSLKDFEEFISNHQKHN